MLVHWNYSYEFSVKHEYEGDWNENTRLTTCNPHAKKLVTSSETPQEVESKKEVIFTYDVEFEVSYHNSQQLNYHCRVLLRIGFGCWFYLTWWNFELVGKWCEVGISVGYLSSNGRWPDSLVFNSKLFDDCTFPFGHGGYDNVADTVSWYLKVQSVRDTRRSTRRDRMETSAWGCVQASTKLRFTVYICWNRCSVFWNDCCDHDVCCPWIFVSLK